MSKFDINNPVEISRALRRLKPQQKEVIFPSLMQDLSTDRPALRRQLYRSYRGWLAHLVKEQGDQIPSRNKMVSHLHWWDHRYRDEQTPELTTLLLQEVPVAMMAALGKAFQWYQRSAEQGYIAAQYFVANCYEEGFGVRENISIATMWYEKTANKAPKETAEIGRKGRDCNHIGMCQY